MEIRKGKKADYVCLLKIFEQARAFMKAQGNGSQWKDNRPSSELVREDLRKGRNYVVVQDREIVGTFVLLPGVEPSYAEIQGTWRNSGPYLTIHRVASAGVAKRIFQAMMDFARKEAKQQGVLSLRIDTHENNQPMRHLIQKAGFHFCGVISVDDGSPRFAYERCITDSF